MVNKVLILLLLCITACTECSFGYKEELNLMKTSSGDPARWNVMSFPLTIYVASDTPEIVVDNLRKVVLDLSKDTKCNLFNVYILDNRDSKFGGLLKFGEISFISTEVQFTINADTYLREVKNGDGLIHSAEVTVGKHIKDKDLYKVIKHELLHVLGLGHDIFKESIMYENAADSAGVVESVDLLYVRNQCRSFIP